MIESLSAGRANPFASGTATIDHLLPFQCSVNRPLSEAPAAKQLVTRGHETPLSSASLELPGLGDVAIVQWLPSQCSIKVLPDPKFCVSESPTAKHSFALADDTPFRLPSSLFERFGVATIDQRVPFQRSTNGRVFVPPTAKQSDAVRHVTPFKPAPLWPLGFGLDMIDQR